MPGVVKSQDPFKTFFDDRLLTTADGVDVPTVGDRVCWGRLLFPICDATPRASDLLAQSVSNVCTEVLARASIGMASKHVLQVEDAHARLLADADRCVELRRAI